MNAALAAALSGGRAPAAWARAVRAAAARGRALPRGAAWLPALLAPAPRLRAGALFGDTFAALTGSLGARTAAAQRAGAAGIGSEAASGTYGPVARRPASLAGAAKRADLPPLPSAAARHADLPLLQRLTSRSTARAASATHPAAALRSTGAVRARAAGAAANGAMPGDTASQASQGAVARAAMARTAVAQEAVARAAVAPDAVARVGMARGVAAGTAIARAGVIRAFAGAAAAGAPAFGGVVRGRLVRRLVGAGQRARPGAPAAAGLEPSLARQWAAPLFGPTATMTLLQSALAAHPNAATTPAPAGTAPARTPVHGTAGAARPGPIRTLPAFAAGAALAAAQAAPAARGRRLVGRFASSPASGAAAALPSPPAGGAVAPPSLVPLLPPLVTPAAAESFGAPSGARLAMDGALAQESAAHDDLLALSFQIERILNEQARRHGIDV